MLNALKVLIEIENVVDIWGSHFDQLFVQMSVKSHGSHLPEIIYFGFR